MNISVRKITEKEIKSDALILPVYENQSFDVYSELDELIGGLIKKVIKSKEFTGKHGQLSLLHVKNINAERLLLVGLGNESDITSEKIRQSGGKSFSYLNKIGIKNLAVSNIPFEKIAKGFSGDQQPVFYFIEGGLLVAYKFDKYKKAENNGRIEHIYILGSNEKLPLKWLQISVSAVNFAKDLVNTPSNDMTPKILGRVAASIADRRTKIKILGQKDVEKEGMGAYMSVAKGSAEPLSFIVLEYKGGKGAPLAIIGKSITFDSGGISIKPADGMEKMKYDMAGGAAVIAIIKAAAEAKLPVNLIGILPAAENLPSGSASKPGDVVTSLSGKTIEIINTDAEGRLALADAVCYAIKYYKPKAVIDIATLTGACSIALGNEAIAMMGNNTEIMENLKRASTETCERVWEMPLYDEYKDYLKSDIADIKNSGGRNGSLVTAGYFLKEFAGDTPWVHLDIASTAWNDKEKPYHPKGATGIGVRLIINMLNQLSKFSAN